MNLFKKISSWAKALKLDVLALWFALKHPKMPFWAKVVCFVAVAYALSPIDLIPDFIPVLGYLDDLILVPALVWLALKLIPAEVMNQSREQAVEWINSNQSKPKSYVGLFIVVAIWLICLVFALSCWASGYDSIKELLNEVWGLEGCSPFLPPAYESFCQV